MPQSPPPLGYPADIPSPASLDALHETMVGCTRCDLALSRTQVVPGSGSRAPRLMLVGEAPGASEDRDGVPFVGASGKLLDSMLQAASIARDEVFVANVVRCRPPENRNPRAREIRACAGWLAEQIRLLQPALIVSLGRFALQHFVPDGRITRLQAELLEVEYGSSAVRLYPLLHPSAVLRSPNLRPTYQAQFEKIESLLA